MAKGMFMNPFNLFFILLAITSIIIFIQLSHIVRTHTWCTTLSCFKNNFVRPKGYEDGRKKTSILLFIAVLNKITQHRRRYFVRNTWMSLCNSYNGSVVCKFFTDSIDQVPEYDREKLKKENLTHNDMQFMPYRGGYNFSLRLVWILKWLTDHYDFKFFLRIDDDHFLCLDRLVAELDQRSPVALYWGFVHCRYRIVRVDEGWLILTSDLIHEALSKLNSTLPCHPYGDQAVAMWMIDSKLNVTYFYDNDRVIHAATAYKNGAFLKPGICDKYLSLHGSYPSLMKKYWDIVINDIIPGMKKRFVIPDIPSFASKCPFSKKIFDVNYFYPDLRFNPKPCKGNPTWSISGKDFYSREKHGELA